MAVGLHRTCGMAAIYAVELLSGRHMPFPGSAETSAGQARVFTSLSCESV